MLVIDACLLFYVLYSNKVLLILVCVCNILYFQVVLVHTPPPPRRQKNLRCVKKKQSDALLTLNWYTAEVKILYRSPFPIRAQRPEQFAIIIR